jgi:[ribosomal protein S18]-alanine N-acetyltransferase
VSFESERPEPAISFAPMTLADIDRVLIVERAAYGYPWSHGVFRDCLSAGYSCWLLEQGVGRQLHGFAIMSIGAGEAHILNLCIHPDRQRRGLGSQMLDHLHGVAGARSVRRLLLEVRPSNTAAGALYERAGFSIIGTRKGYYPAACGREDAVVMTLDVLPEYMAQSHDSARPDLARP